MRESNHNHKSSFNILQVLSMYRLLYPADEENIYQAIIYMTKTHNPQNLVQWKRALNSINL